MADGFADRAAQVDDAAALRALVEQQARQLAEIQRTSAETQALLAARTARPYYPLDDGWALTHLDTGQPFFVNTRDRSVTPWILMGGHWETNVSRVLAAFTQPGMHVVDVGAHMGYYTIKLGALVGPAGRVASFEPNPHMAIYAEKNIGISGLYSIATLHRIALGDQAGAATLTYAANDISQANIVGHFAEDHAFVVGVQPLDAFLFSAVDLIKIDAEGAEPLVLRGARQTLLNSPNCAVMIEVNLHRWEEICPLDELFAAMGDRTCFLVSDAGLLRQIRTEDVAGHLSGCLFTEAYLFFCPETRRDAIRTLVGY